MTKTKHFMFMRFYDKSKKKCEKFLKSLQTLDSNLIGFEEVEMNTSVNPIILGEAYEYHLFFKTKKMLTNFYANSEVTDLYQKFLKGKVMKRKPGDQSFSV